MENVYKYEEEEFEYDCIANANNENELNEIDYINYNASPYQIFTFVVFLMNNKDYVLVNYDEDGKMISIKNIDEFTEQDFSSLKFENSNLNEIVDFNSYVKYIEFNKTTNVDEETSDIMILLENNDEYKSYKEEYKIKIENNSFYVNDKKISIKDNNEELKVKKVYITGTTDDCFVWSRILVLTTNNKLYYYNYYTKKIKEINPSYKYTDVYEVDFKESDMPILVAKTTDNKYYSLIDDKIFNYAHKHYIYDENDEDIIYVNFDGSIENSENVSYKAKNIYGSLVLTTENKLFSLDDIKLISDKEVKEIYIKNEDSHYYLIVAKFTDDTIYARYDPYYNWTKEYCINWYANLDN